MKKILFSIVLLGTVVVHADICGKLDDRFPHEDGKVARFTDGKSAVGCTLTMISNSCAITTSICNDKLVAEFNVPPAVNREPSFAAPQDVYEVDKVMASSTGGVGAHWSVVKLRPNSITGKLPGEVQGFYEVEKTKSPAGSKIKVLSYSFADNTRWDVRVGDTPPNPYDLIINRSQSIAKGTLVKSGIFLLPNIIEFTADTYAGSVGAAVINVETEQIVGVVTHGGCRANYGVKLGARYTNSGTSITGNKNFKKAVQACIASK